MGKPLATIAQWLERNPEQPFSDRIAKGASVFVQMASARLRLRACDQVGSMARAIGAPRIVNRGRIEIGSEFIINSRWVPVELATGPSGRIEIGDGVRVNFGTIIAAKRRVKIGNRVRIGQHVILSDTEVPEPIADEAEEAMPIEIGDDVWLAGRVTVLPGARIGARSVVSAGSIVSGEIPPGVVARGIPARVVRRVNSDPGAGAPDRGDGVGDGPG